MGFGVREYGIVNTSLGVGSAIGAVAFSLIVIKNPRPSMVLLTVFLQGITLSFIGLSNHLWLILIFYIIIGIEEAAINILAPSVNHVIIPQRIFGRVLSVMILMMTISQPFSQAGAGWLMETIHPQYIFIGSGIMEVLVALVTFSFPVIRNHSVGNIK
ncbi:MFS transporter [Sporolactobacillus shoreae]|uniref:MFS transporter n=1 Tax=Sporolactobacillus shoreae TaxID=1465501 RepID=A0A4Z0GJ47_9BACL|nr:MFS transporter [Sporolactobacillus shoreae]TGA95930.1 MFS transporter [Sporolactobacillus shoreae]